MDIAFEFGLHKKCSDCVLCEWSDVRIDCELSQPCLFIPRS